MMKKHENIFNTVTVNTILDRLSMEYPQAECALDYETNFQLLVAVTLSAQTTDKSVNRISGELFRRYPTPLALSRADEQDLQSLLKPVGMYRTKSANIKAQAAALTRRFDGKVPGTYDELITLPGVGRKTANVVLSVGFGEQRIAVDTHVFRLANRIGLAQAKDVLATEKQLMEAIPKDRWTQAHHSLIFHGRNCCTARKPACDRCVILDLCAQRGVAKKEKAPADGAAGETPDLPEAAKEVLGALDRLDIPYTLHCHEACFTVEQAKRRGLSLPGMNVKNLVIMDPKTKAYYMVVLLDDSRLDFKAMRRVTGWSGKATFASDEEIFRLLGVHIGHCSIFGLINDKENHITVVLQGAIAHAPEDAIINFHPNVNTSTVSLRIGDMYRFLAQAGNPLLLEP